eukprot:983784-Amphidinium_carterae.1
MFKLHWERLSHGLEVTGLTNGTHLIGYRLICLDRSVLWLLSMKKRVHMQWGRIAESKEKWNRCSFKTWTAERQLKVEN